MATGHHAARARRGRPGHDRRRVGDGTVGAFGVIAAKRLGAEQIILLGRHADRIALAREFGATDVVSERGNEAVERIRELTNGFGATPSSSASAPRRPSSPRSGSRVPAARSAASAFPHYEAIPDAIPSFFVNVTVSGGPAPARAYIEELCRTSSKAGSSPAASSTASRASTRYPTATGR